MLFAHHHHRRSHISIWPVLGVLVVGYFLYHTVQGDRGLVAMVRMKNEVAAAQTRLTDLQKEREDLQRRTRLLHSKSMDPDLLEEKSRELLNYSRPNEIIIIAPAKKDHEQDEDGAIIAK